jgi:antitoxin (DNA-binding transcriptional repressor) of toxin-antitoxin stability system
LIKYLTQKEALGKLKLNLMFNLENPMKMISLLEFRKNAKATLQKVARGQSIVLTRRGKAVARLEPVMEKEIGPEDPLYSLGDLAGEGKSMTNEQMDREVYDD